MKIVTVKLEILVPDEYVPGPDILDDMEDRYSSVSLHSIEILQNKKSTIIMDQKTHLICETAQYMTLDAWPIIYGEDNKYDQDSRNVMETIREWAEEFEDWWQSHDEDWMDANDYLIELDDFTEKKAKEYIKGLED